MRLSELERKMADAPARAILTKFHSLVAVSLLLMLLTLTVALVVLARDEQLSEWMDARERRHAEMNKWRWIQTGHFRDHDDQLLLDQLTRLDYSRGGVYFVGSSNLEWALNYWDWPPEERALVHNIGIGGTNHQFQFQVVRFLVERKGLLQAGGEKILIICGVSYHCVGHEYRKTGYFPNLWSRHGLYKYDLGGGIQDVSVCPFNRFRIVEKARVAGFLRRTRSHLVDWLRQVSKSATPRVHDPAAYNKLRREFMGRNWRRKLDEQLGEFSRMLDYLRERRVSVVVVLMPQGSWEGNLPYASTYAERVRSLCASQGVKLVDRFAFLADDDFADSNHPTLAGANKVSQVMMELAREHLRRINAGRGPEY
jgi:hypothetical protein